MEEPSAAAGRKRNNRLGEMQLDLSSIQLKARRLDVVGQVTSDSAGSSENSACESASAASDHALASCCSSNGSSAKWTSKFVDLEEGEVSPELLSTSVGESLNFRERRQIMTPPWSEVEPRHSNSCRQLPSEAELEDFFSLAEQNIQKEFMDKYNFDIVKDEPLEGRYEWVEIKLKP